MEKEVEKFPIGTTMLTFILIMVMYIYTYNRGLSSFWIFFIIERLVAFSYEEYINIYISNPEMMSNLGNKKNITLLIFSVANILLFTYIFFTSAKLFLILIFGEIIDLALKSVKKIITKRK